MSTTEAEHTELARNFFEDTIAEGDKVVTRVSVQATHEGELLGVEATGETVEFDGMALFSIEDGQITEMWVQGDFMGLMEQLGVQ